MRYYHTPIRMPIIPNVIFQNAGKDVAQLEPSFIAGGFAKFYSSFGRYFGSFVQC